MQQHRDGAEEEPRGYIFCIICKKGVKYSGNTTDLFKHVRNHAEENEELKKRREERIPPPDPDRPRGLSVKQCPGG